MVRGLWPTCAHCQRTKHLDGPLCVAAFYNELDRPTLIGYFCAFDEHAPSSADAGPMCGYHKPIMLTGILDTVRPQFMHKTARGSLSSAAQGC